MAFSLEPDSRRPGPWPWLVLLLCGLFVFAGVLGHDPWKSEDAIHLAVAHDFAKDGHWLTPTLAGEPWFEVEPLYHWLAAASGIALGGALPFHEGGRLAAALMTAMFLACLAGAARHLFRPEVAWAAPLLAIGTLGVLIPLHEAQPASTILAAISAAYWGAARLSDRPVAGGILMGVGLGTTFLAGGLIAVLPLLTLVAVPLWRRQWRAAATVLLVGTGTAASWPAMLAYSHPTHVEGWWAAELALITPRGIPGLAHLEWLSWFAWPVLLIAGWTVWRHRRQLSSSRFASPFLGAIVAMIWLLMHEPKVPVSLPLLPPLVLLASAGAEHLRRGAANAWDWFGMMTFSLMVALVWLGASALLLGWPAKIAANAARIAPGFTADFPASRLTLALIITIGWMVLLRALPRSPWRAAAHWAAGITALWALIATLLMPWIDHGKTYRPVVASLHAALPADGGCVARRGLGASQRAALDYFAGIRTVTSAGQCAWLLVQGHPRDKSPAGWKKVWEGLRPGDRDEVWRLYRAD